MAALEGFSNQFLQSLASASIRSLCLAGLVLLILTVWRRRTAHVEHGVWTVVLVLMLILPAVNFLMPSLRVPVPSALGRYESRPATPVQRITVQEPIVLDVTEGRPLTVQSTWKPASGLRWPVVIAMLYLAGVFAFAMRLVIAVFGTARLGSTVLRNSLANDVLTEIAEEHAVSYPLPQLSESEWIHVACVVGGETRSILLPSEWRQWNAWKLRAVLAHELTHIRRGDWTITLIASVNKAVFWFHPLAWWLEKRLSTLAEQACDEGSVRVTGDSTRYAEVLLGVAAALPPGGRRIKFGSAASLSMASQPQVSRRIERILDLRNASSGVLPQRTWALVVALVLPLYCAVAAAQVAASPKPVQPSDMLAPLAWPAVGMKVSPAEAEQLERDIANGSADLEARAKLIAFYNYNALAGKAESHVEWIIENHPGSPTAGAVLMYSSYPPPTDAHMRRKRELWLRQTTIHSSNPGVLGNAAKFFMGTDPARAEGLLKRAMELNPQDPALLAQLGKLYVSAIRAGIYLAAGLDPVLNQWRLIDSSFAKQVKDDLDRSQSAMLVGTVGLALLSEVSQTFEVRKNQEAQVEQVRTSSLQYAEFLLKRAQSLQPGNPQWPQGLARLQSLPAMPSPYRPDVPRPVRPPAADPGSGAQRIRVSGAVQESKLLQGEQPVYPPLAQQSRIQGTVWFNVVIGRDGRVTNTTLSSGHPLLVPSAMQALQTHAYQPTTLDGQPVEVETVVDIKFTLPH